MRQSGTSRRQILAYSAMAIGPGRSVFAEGRKLKVIVAGGHPGDPEYGCGGTICRYTDQEQEVVLFYLNRGEKTCPATASDPGALVRVAEAKRACQILKARAEFAGQCDGHAIVDGAHYEAFGELIRAERPDVLFTHWPIDHHADHRAMSMLCLDAWTRLGRTFALYYYEVSDGEDTEMYVPAEYVDITAVEPRKRAACYAHASQAPERYYALQSQVARFRGVESGHVQAEAFVRHIGSPSGWLPR